MDSFFGFSAPILEHIIGAIKSYQFRYVSVSWAGGSSPPHVNQTFAIPSADPYLAIIFGIEGDTTVGPFMRWPNGRIELRDETVSSSMVVKWIITFQEHSFTFQSGNYSNYPTAHTFQVPMLFAFIDPQYILNED